MDKKTVSERLNALASNDAKRTKAARLRDVIDDVESALASGVPRTKVLETLNQLGLGMSLSTFDMTLHRIRAKQKPTVHQAKTFPATENNSPAISEPKFKRSQKPAAENKTEDPPGQDKSHDPADLDSIMRSTPDLDTLAKAAKKGRKK